MDAQIDRPMTDAKLSAGKQPTLALARWAKKNSSENMH